MTKFKTFAVGLTALLLPLAACTTPQSNTAGPASSPSGSPSSSASTAPSETPAADPTVDRDPKGELPEITFDAGKPSMKVVTADAPKQITVKTLKQGDGTEVGAGAYVKVNYAGFLWSDGSEFDSSYSKSPIGFSLNQVVDGWRLGLEGTKVGDQVEIVVPPQFGYGDQEQANIPAGSTLVFVVDLIDVTNVTTDAVKAAKPVDAELPAGLTVSGNPGEEPKLTFAADAKAPTEAQVIVLAEGTGPAITAKDTVFYHATGAQWGGPQDGTWSDRYQVLEPGVGAEVIGKTVGTRLLLTYPGEEGAAGEAVVIDLLGAVASE